MKCLAVAVLVAGLPSCVSGSEWQQCAPLPLARAGYAAGVLGDKLIVAGGSFWPAETKTKTKTNAKTNTKTRVARVDAYLPACDCWQFEAPMPAAVSDAASTVADEQLFVPGGNNEAGASDKVFGFDGRAWMERPDMRLPEPRTNGMAVTEGRRLLP